MAIRADETAQLGHVRADLRRSFAHLPEAAVDREFTRALDGFASARVRTFVPVMVQKQATEALRRRESELVATT